MAEQEQGGYHKAEELGWAADELTIPPLTEEDPEDAWMREGEVAFSLLSPEDQAGLRKPIDDLIARMQTPEARAGIQCAFEHGFGARAAMEPKPPEDVDDLLELMNDPGMVAVMRRAVADEKEMRARPAAVFDNSEEGRRNAEMLSKLAVGMATLEEAGPAFSRHRDGTLGVKMGHGSVADQDVAELPTAQSGI